MREAVFFILKLSDHISNRQPSAIRKASILFTQREDSCKALNVAIGNVSLPMHPAMIERMFNLDGDGSPFAKGVVRYSGTIGLDETRQAFKKILEASGYDVDKLNVQITDGGSQAMELVLTSCCGPVGEEDCPVLAIDAAYTNYRAFAQRLRRKVISFSRYLDESGKFELPEFAKIEELIIKERPSALIVIPYDNPTGQLYSQEMFNELAALCVKYDMWMISDEAYRELYYVDGVEKAVSVWSISEEDVPGITGRRLSIESTSKVWNACGLRVGALITDNVELHKLLVAENTVSLCTNVIGQWIFAAMNKLTLAELREWFCKQRDYYKPLMEKFCTDMRASLPGVIVSSAQASLYEVVDVRELVNEDFNADAFVVWCASEGYIEEAGEKVTLLTAPMSEFYSEKDLRKNYGRTQMRIAFIEMPELMSKVPTLFAQLFRKYLQVHSEFTKE